MEETDKKLDLINFYLEFKQLKEELNEIVRLNKLKTRGQLSHNSIN